MFPNRVTSVLGLAVAAATTGCATSMTAVPSSQSQTPPLERSAVAKPSGTAAGHYAIGAMDLASGRHASSVARFRAALELDPRHVEALNGIGVAYGETGRHAEAVLSFEQALSIAPDSAHVLSNLGYAQLRAGRADEAWRSLSRSFELDPSSPRTRANLLIALQSREKAPKDAAPANTVRIESASGDTATMRVEPTMRMGHSAVSDPAPVVQSGPAADAAVASHAVPVASSPAPVALSGPAPAAPPAPVASTAPHADTPAPAAVAATAPVRVPEAPAPVVATVTPVQVPEAPAPVVVTVTPVQMPEAPAPVVATVTPAQMPEAPAPFVVTAAPVRPATAAVDAYGPFTVVTNRPDDPGLIRVSANVYELRPPEKAVAVAVVRSPAGASGTGRAVTAAARPVASAPVTPKAPMTTDAGPNAVRAGAGPGPRLEVSNGVGLSRLATRTAAELTRLGYPQARLTNARPYGTAQSQVLYRPGHEAQARQLAEAMGVEVEFLATDRLSTAVDVRLVLGLDLATWEQTARLSAPRLARAPSAPSASVLPASVPAGSTAIAKAEAARL